MGLGVYPSVALGQARQKAQDARRKLAEGNDPSVTAKRRAAILEAARSLTLSQAIDDYLAKAAPTFKNAKSTTIRERALRVHFAPLHSRDVASIMVADVAAILRTLKPQTAVKSHAAIRAVFDFAATVLEAHGVPWSIPPIRGVCALSAGRRNRRGRPRRIRRSTGDRCLNSWPSWLAMTTPMRGASP